MEKIKILFVCLGNICRSPSAEAVMKEVVKSSGLSDQFMIDSAGTSGWHSGEKADSRMRKHAQKRDYDLTSLSRPVKTTDFDEFDYIVGMDDDNIFNLEQMTKLPEHQMKIIKMTDYCQNHDASSVPDPYYGGDAGFELVLDILEDSCNGLLKHIIETHDLL